VRLLVALAAVAAASVTLAASASAHLVIEQGQYLNGPLCAFTSSSIAGLGNESGPGGQVAVEHWTQAYAPTGYNCFTAKNIAAYNIYMGRSLYFWDESSQVWREGAWSGWVQNTEATSYKMIFRQWSNMPNGARWYGNYGFTWLIFNGQWYDNARWSGYHWLW
jgi:hypothetical protein